MSAAVTTPAIMNEFLFIAAEISQIMKASAAPKNPYFKKRASGPRNPTNL